MNELEHRLSRVLIASGIVAGLLAVILWSITNPAKFYAIWPVGNQAWAIVGFVVASIVMFISGLIGFSEVVGYVRSSNCNVAGAFAGIFFFLLVSSLLVIYGEHLYYQMEVYSNNPDLKIFTGWKCADIEKLGNEFPEVNLLHGYPYYYPDDYRKGIQLPNCGNDFHLTNNAIWNGTGWIEPTQHSSKAEWNGTTWLEPPTSLSIWNSTTNSWTLTNTTYTFTENKTQPEKDIVYCDYGSCPPPKVNDTEISQDALTEGTKIQQQWDGKIKDCSWIDSQTGITHNYYSTSCSGNGMN